MREAGRPFGLFDRDFYTRPSIDSGLIHPAPQLVGVNNQIFLGKKLERAVPFHIDGAAKVAFNCREGGSHQLVNKS
jgi:hypothetical protein